jgi:chromosome segregation ATPase
MGKFSVKALAEELSVPRTTVNDWLNRYEQYIECSLQGKRRVYSINSLNVLREISKLRGEGLSSFEIEEALAIRYPVQGVVASEKKENMEEALAVSPSSSEYATIVKLQVEEMSNVIGEYVQNMTTRLDELEDGSKALMNLSEESANKIIQATREETMGLQLLLKEHINGLSSKIESLEEENKVLLSKGSNIGIWATVLALAFVVIGGALFATYITMEKLTKNEGVLAKTKGELQKTEGKFSVTQKVLDEKKKQLELTLKSRQKLRETNTILLHDIAKLQNDLKGREERFNTLQKEIKNSKDNESKKAAELAKLRDNFAQERLTFLKKMDTLAKSAKIKNDKLNELENKRLAEQKKLKEILEKTAGQLKEINKKLNEPKERIETPLNNITGDN